MKQLEIFVTIDFIEMYNNIINKKKELLNDFNYLLKMIEWRLGKLRKNIFYIT